MPEIIVMTNAADGSPEAVMLRERVNSADFESSHFAAQLAERVGWAVGDADDAERSRRRQPAGETPDRN